MSVPMIVVDSDSLLVERKEGADCAICMPALPAPALEQQSGDTTDEENDQPSSMTAMAVYGDGNVPTPRQLAYWLLNNNVSDIDTGLLADICEELMINKLTAVCLMSENSGFMIHSVVRMSGGDWECTTTKGEPNKYAVVTSDGVIHLNDRTIEAESPDLHALDVYATYARHNNELSNNFDHYIGVIGEIIENASI